MKVVCINNEAKEGFGNHIIPLHQLCKNEEYTVKKVFLDDYGCLSYQLEEIKNKHGFDARRFVIKANPSK